MGHVLESVRREYRHSTDLGARRHAVEFLVHEKLFLRAACGITLNTGDVRVLYSQRAHNVLTPVLRTL